MCRLLGGAWGCLAARNMPSERFHIREGLGAPIGNKLQKSIRRARGQDSRQQKSAERRSTRGEASQILHIVCPASGVETNPGKCVKQPCCERILLGGRKTKTRKYPIVMKGVWSQRSKCNFTTKTKTAGFCQNPAVLFFVGFYGKSAYLA